jgi:hypothetical protein
VYINFLSSIPRPLLEDLATQVAASNTAYLVSQVYDQYLNFIVTEENLFSCGIPNVYYTLNQPTVAETVIEETINRIVSSLFSVAVTLGTNTICDAYYRDYTDYSLSEGKCGGNDCAEIRWQIT